MSTRYFLTQSESAHLEKFTTDRARTTTLRHVTAMAPAADRLPRRDRERPGPDAQPWLRVRRHPRGPEVPRSERRPDVSRRIRPPRLPLRTLIAFADPGKGGASLRFDDDRRRRGSETRRF